MANAYTTVRTRARAGTLTPQREQARPDEVVNNEGGYVFDGGDDMVLDRFLVLGSESPTYYASAQKLTKTNAARIQAMIAKDGLKVVQRVVEISQANRAPKNDPALFVLAMASAAKDGQVRHAAFEALPKVARIPTHLFDFWTYSQQFRGSGRALRRAIADWYIEDKNLAYHAVKYQSRNGVSNRDMLRLARPNPTFKDGDTQRTLQWVVKGIEAFQPTSEDPLRGDSRLPAIIRGFEELKRAESEKEAAHLVREYRLPREAVPTHFLNSREVWEALLEVDMPYTAMIRNLAKMTSIGLISPFSDGTKRVVEQLANTEALKKARVHPIQLLSALRTYSGGHGVRGNLTWTPDQQVMAALESAFYESFKTIEPTGKRHLLAFDISSSMGGGEIAGVPGLAPYDAEAAMGLVTVKVEPEVHTFGFSHAFVPININKHHTITQATHELRGRAFGGTDCALPMTYALQNKIPVDTFVVYTDNETHSGRVGHPFQVLKKYRDAMGIPAKLIVVGFTATGFTIADPTDPGMLDVVGFDSAAPQVMADFTRR